MHPHPETPPSSRSTAAAERQDSPLGNAVSRAIRRSSEWLSERQADDGHWCAELQGDTILESEYLLLLTFLGREQSELARRVARYLAQQQLPGGGWALYPGGRLDVSASVKAYFALKLTGHDPAGEAMTRARRAIRAAGGADRVNSFTRFFLAVLGQIPYELCPAVPPELVLLPARSPLSIYSMSSWSRTIVVPLSIVWARQPVRGVEPGRGIRELFLRDPAEWPPLRRARTAPGQAAWDHLFAGLDALLRWCRRHGVTPMRRRAVAAAERWMLDRFDRSDGLGAIFPSIVWAAIALRSLGYDEHGPEVQSCLKELEALAIEEPGSGAVRIQPCQSPVWDTAISLRALLAAGCPRQDPRIARGAAWLLARQIRRSGDWEKRVRAEAGGWCFEYRNDFYPDVDDTAMVLMALREAGTDHPAIERGLRWMLAMQNRDGGWGAFDRNNDRRFLCRVPFADHNAMIDPSTPDLTARVLECLGQFGRRLGDPPVDRAVAYLRRTQESDGSWCGRWGVNYIYGTWQALTGLAAAGLSADDPAVSGGRDWLLDHQQPSGGWGESADSYDEPRLRGFGPATASQTAWAVLGLTAAGLGGHPAVVRAVDFLVGSQTEAGAWDEPYFTGTGFPRVFYLRYHYYPVYFPAMALARWLRACPAARPRPEMTPSP
jgi:squalene-hopene/tetraprenyl-beta-curcumene cyclase